MSLSIKKPEQEEGVKGVRPRTRHSKQQTCVRRLHLQNSPKPLDCQFPSSVTKRRIETRRLITLQLPTAQSVILCGARETT